MSVGFGNRKIEALNAMAAQSASPNEAEIARQKLAEVRRRDDSEAIDDIVKRWGRGGYSGLKVRTGATVETRW